MTDGVNGAAEDEIAQKTMAVRGHRNQITLFALGGFQDFSRRIAQGELSGDFQAGFAQPRGTVFELRPVLFHLLGFGQLQLVEIACHPAIGHVYQ